MTRVPAGRPSAADVFAPRESGREFPTLAKAAEAIRSELDGALAEVKRGGREMLPGNCLFLGDGRVACFDRQRGDSRFPYGRGGLNFWVCSSGYIYANRGQFSIFRHAQEGDEPQIAFFAGTRGAGEDGYSPLPLLPVPYLHDAERRVGRRYTVIGHDATHFLTDLPELRTTVRVFVAQSSEDDVQIRFSILIENPRAEEQDLYTSAYMNPFCRHQFAPTSEDRWFKRAEYHEPGADARAAAFTVAVNEDIDRFQSVTNHLLVRRAIDTEMPLVLAQSCTARRAYMGGPRIGLSEAKCLREGRFAEPTSKTVFNDMAIVGDMLRFRLGGGGVLRLDYALSLPPNEDALAAERREPLLPGRVDARFAEHAYGLLDAPHDLHWVVRGSRIPGVAAETFNQFFPYLRTQVEVCAEMRGYMQPSPNSLIGIRDVFQAIEGHMYDRPKAARRKILEALEFVLVDGRCPRQYSLPVNGQTGRCDLREFIDQGCWVIGTVCAYVRLTGDIDILRQKAGYHRICPNSPSSIEPAGERDTVTAHLVRIARYLARQRDPQTRLVLALYGDWNDALDGLGIPADPNREFGTGVSVMASLQFYQNCTEMIELLRVDRPDNTENLIQELAGVRSELQEGLLCHAVVQRGEHRRIVHGWGDGRSHYVGSFRDSDGRSRDGLTSNAFWVTSGMLDPDPTLRDDILKALQRLDSPFGLKTFEPGFDPDAPGVGRIPNLPIGTAENGATYVHATLFGVAALFELDEPEKAWRQIYKILPFFPHHTGLSHSPFVMPNSYVHNPDLNLTGQNMNDWQTGSSNVLLKVLIRYAFGFQPQFDELRVCPAAWSPFDEFTFTARAHGRFFEITHHRENVSTRQFCVSGEPVPPSDHAQAPSPPSLVLPYDRLPDSGVIEIEVTDPAASCPGNRLK